MPTFAEYVPVVSATVSDGTRKAYGSYWNRVVEQWGTRKLDEPSPSEIKQLVAYVRGNAVPPQCPRRAQRRRESDRRAPLPLQARRGGRVHRRAGQPRQEGGQAAPPAVNATGGG